MNVLADLFHILVEILTQQPPHALENKRPVIEHRGYSFCHFSFRYSSRKNRRIDRRSDEESTQYHAYGSWDNLKYKRASILEPCRKYPGGFPPPRAQYSLSKLGYIPPRFGGLCDLRRAYPRLLLGVSLKVHCSDLLLHEIRLSKLRQDGGKVPELLGGTHCYQLRPRQARHSVQGN